jgi:hypothetical protein
MFNEGLAAPMQSAILAALRDSVAGVAELVDAADSKSAALKSVWVRFPPPAPSQHPTSSVGIA